MTMKKREIDTAARFGLLDRMQALENDLTAIPGTTYFSPSELLNFSSKVATRTGLSAKEIFDDLCYLLGPHYWEHAYNYAAAVKEVTPE